jgi:hypothetical protein
MGNGNETHIGVGVEAKQNTSHKIYDVIDKHFPLKVFFYHGGEYFLPGGYQETKLNEHCYSQIASVNDMRGPPLAISAVVHDEIRWKENCQEDLSNEIESKQE